jgi:hypothetical protein
MCACDDYAERQCIVVAFSIVVVKENNKLSGLEEQQQHDRISIVHMFFTKLSLKATCKTLHHYQHYWNIVSMLHTYQKLIMNRDPNQQQQQQENDEWLLFKHPFVPILQLVQEQQIDMIKDIIMYLQHLVVKVGGVVQSKYNQSDIFYVS